MPAPRRVGPVGSADRAVAWALANVGAGPKKIAKWDTKAGFALGTAWCGIFLGAVMRAMGMQPPSGYASAHEWSSYGTSVKSRNELRPGDIIVYGYNHVAMYIGGGRQIQGNNSDETVGTSAIGDGLGLGPITAMRRPPYKRGSASRSLLSRMNPAERKRFEEIAEHENLGSGVADVVPGVHTVENAAGDAAGAVAEGLAGLLSDHAEAFMLNLGLVGGGAFLVYYGAALVLGVKQPAKAIIRSASAAAAVAPK